LAKRPETAICRRIKIRFLLAAERSLKNFSPEITSDFSLIFDAKKSGEN